MRTLNYAAALSVFSVALAVTRDGAVFARAATNLPDRPNIVFILTDDQDAPSVDMMPQLRALLVEQGTSFSNFYASFPLCCPSRASILRGQYARNHQILGNDPPLGGFTKFRDLGHEGSTLATWLTDAGYRTALVGKYLNRYADASQVPPGWSEWYAWTEGRGNYFNYSLSENGEIVTYGRRPEDYQTDVTHLLSTLR